MRGATIKEQTGGEATGAGAKDYAFFDLHARRDKYEDSEDKEEVRAPSRLIPPDGGRSDFVWPSARTPHGGASYVW